MISNNSAIHFYAGNKLSRSFSIIQLIFNNEMADFSWQGEGFYFAIEHLDIEVYFIEGSTKNKKYILMCIDFLWTLMYLKFVIAICTGGIWPT